MPSAVRQWHLRPHDEQAVRRLAATARVPEVVAALLLNRGVTEPADARLFLDAPVQALHRPELLPGIPEAAGRIVSAIHDRRRICIYGDYDVDGTTGTAVLVSLLTRLGADVVFHVPLRLEEGYGLNGERIRTLAQEGVQMLVTVDCGIASILEADIAREVGLELIVTDHHEMKDRLPAADVLVHPRLPGSNYPFGGLSGSCVAFKLAWEIAVRMSPGNSGRASPELREFLLDAMGIAALGLVADVVPLRDENRVFVRHGLKRLVEKPSAGMRALLASASLDPGRGLRAEDVAFRLAPRLNAAGRLGCARLVVELLTTNSSIKANEIAEYLEKQNSQRQSLERKITSEAKEWVEREGYDKQAGIVLAHADWHQGVIGIVAGRLADAYARPVLIAALAADGGVSSGSGRSVPGFPLHLALAACNEHLIGHGGHAMAAGFRFMPQNLDRLRACFEAHARQYFQNGPPSPRLVLDSELPLSALTNALLRDIDKLEPYGADNPRPRFLASGVTIEGTPKKIGTGERHLSLRVRQGNTTLRAVGFGMAERCDELMSEGGRCSLAFTPKLSNWKGVNSVEIELNDFQAGDTLQLH